MNGDAILALAGFALVTSITPGPSNLLLLASGLNFGFRRSLPAALGVSGGFLTLLVIVGAGLGLVLQGGTVAVVFRVACLGYVLWLAWTVARSRPQGHSEIEALAQALSFWQAWWLQWINPKAWTVAALTAASYLSGASLWELVTLAAVFGVVNFPSVALWAAFGVFLRKFFSDPKARVVNVLLALLLVASMGPVLLHLFWG